MQTMARPTIRPACDRDARALRSIIAEANEEFRGQVPDAFFRSYLASVLDVDARVAQGAMVFIAEHQGVLVGSISYYRDANDEGMDVGFPTRTAGIRATAVHPGARGLGIGRGLVDACLDRARADDSSGIALHTAAFMRAAIRLYEASGFQRVSTFDYPVGLFFPSDPGEQMVAMAYLRGLGTDLKI
jgi:ribosomal protein S18 acetylase RimI-like enzyme